MKRLSYKIERARIGAKLLRQAAEFFGIPEADINECSLIIDLAGGDWHKVIGWSFAVEEKWNFTFPDPRIMPKTGRTRQSKAETIKDLRGYIEHISRLKRPPKKGLQ
jgi:hypothetical protein